MVPVHVGFHLVFGLGVGIIFRYGLVVAQRWGRASPEARNG